MDVEGTVYVHLLKNIIPCPEYTHPLVCVFHYPIIIPFSSSGFHIIPHGGSNSISAFSSSLQSSQVLSCLLICIFRIFILETQAIPEDSITAAQYVTVELAY